MDGAHSCMLSETHCEPLLPKTNQATEILAVSLTHIEMQCVRADTHPCTLGVACEE
jgi:hypothetical protein